jgi:hypothetical protein
LPAGATKAKAVELPEAAGGAVEVAEAEEGTVGRADAFLTIFAGVATGIVVGGGGASLAAGPKAGAVSSPIVCSGSRRARLRGTAGVASRGVGSSALAFFDIFRSFLSFLSFLDFFA